MRVLSGEEVQDLLPMQPLIAQLRVAFLNPCVCPARQVVSLPGGSGDRQLLYMPAFDPAGAAVVKFAMSFRRIPRRVFRRYRRQFGAFFIWHAGRGARWR